MSITIKIGQERYKLLDEIGNVSIVDSFVKVNKLLPTIKNKMPGHGEARLYLGSQNQSATIDNFFDNYSHHSNCFFLKTDLLKYLNDAKYEYENQEQTYNIDIKDSWAKYHEEVNSIADTTLTFNIETANSGNDKDRYYIRSLNSRKDYPWVLFRKITLPKITYVSILKLEDVNKHIFYYFNLFIDYQYNSVNHPSKIRTAEKEIEKKRLPKEKKDTLFSARLGQGKFRDGILKQMFACPFTQVTDERILVASHIKPWSVSDEKEKIDAFNGIMFTPTFDRLFDQGYISFNDDGQVLISPYISPLNRKRLSLIPDKIIDIKPVGREKYLQYHRENIFKK